MLRITATPKDFERFDELGRGGEAVTYRVRSDTAAKIFHHPNDEIFAHQPEARAAADVRIREMQTKLYEFPPGLPPNAVIPTGVLVTPNNIAFGYIMPFIAGVSFEEFSRTDGRMSLAERIELLLRLHETIQQLHLRGVVLGDIKDKNLMAWRRMPYVLDTDPFQSRRYQCRTFDPMFCAPELLKAAKPPKNNGNGLGLQPTFTMQAPHTPMTDWYSFLVVAMRMLTFTGPFGGVVENMDHAERLRKRITVFDRRTVYPRMAIPLDQVPRPALELFYRAFHLGHRFEPDVEVFRALTPPTRPMLVSQPPQPKKKWKEWYSWIRSKFSRRTSTIS